MRGWGARLPVCLPAACCQRELPALPAGPQVNRRLGAEDKPGAAFPHIQFPPVSLCSSCRSGEATGEGNEEVVPWQEDEVYTFLLSYYSGEQQKESGGGVRARHSGWSDAALLVALVAGCVYAVLRRSGQYALRKSDSRIL